MQRIAGLSALKYVCLFNFDCIADIEVLRCILGNLCPGVLQRKPLEKARASFYNSYQIL